VWTYDSREGDMSWGKIHDMVRCPEVFGPGVGILDRFVNISYSWLNRIICTYSVRITNSIFKVLEGLLYSFTTPTRSGFLPDPLDLVFRYNNNSRVTIGSQIVYHTGSV
jgi:hypothetical protein